MGVPMQQCTKRVWRKFAQISDLLMHRLIVTSLVDNHILDNYNKLLPWIALSTKIYMYLYHELKMHKTFNIDIYMYDPQSGKYSFIRA